MKEYHTLNNFVVFAIVIGVMSIYAIGGTADQSESFMDFDALLAGSESTYGSIKTMRVSYSYRLVDYKPPINDPNMPAPVAYQHVERVEDGKRYHIRYSLAEDGFDRPESLMEHAFDGKITREYWGSRKNGTICTGLTGRDVEHMNRFKEFTLTEPQIAPDYLKEEYPNGVTMFILLSILRKSSAVIRPYLETVAGQPCHVVELSNIKGRQPGSKKDIFWLAHDKGMCLMKYQRYEHNKMDMEIEVEQIAMADMDGTSIWYPVKVRRKEENDFGNFTEELTVKQFVPNVKVVENTFQFDFPAGTDVYDMISGLSYVVGGTSPDGEVSPVHAVEPVEETQAAEETTDRTPNLVESAPEGKEDESGELADEGQDKDRMPIETVPDKDKTFGTKTFSIFGVIVLAAFGLLIWYKRSAHS